MPAPANGDEFIDLIRKSGVVEEARLNTYLKQLQSMSGIPTDVQKFSRLLVRDGMLTFFQSEQFLLGKWKRFTIGKYKVLERLGSGGMGQVFLCEHKLMRRKVAVKVLPTARAGDSSSLERFYREAQAVAALDHPNIVRAYDIDQDDNLHFLVMEYVDGASLQDLIKKFGPMDVTRCCHYIYWSAIGLQHAHAAGLIHRDIKPGNILVDRQGTVKILDLGLARFFNDDEDNITKKYDENVLGTADYLAPEQAIDSHNVDGRADIYSLGATFYFMLTASPPFSDGTVAQKLIWHQTRNPKSIRDIRPEVPEGVAAIVERMMAKNSAERYQDPMELAEALTPWVQTPVDPPPEREMPQLSAAAQSIGGGMSTATVRQMPASPRTDGGSDAKRGASGSGSGSKKASGSGSKKASGSGSGSGSKKAPVPTNAYADRGSQPSLPAAAFNSSTADAEQTKRRNAPAPIVENLPASELGIWESLASDTSENTHENTDRQRKPAPRPQKPQQRPREEPLELPPERPLKKSRRIPGAILIAVSTVLAGVASYAAYWFFIRTPAKPLDTPSNIVEGPLTVSRFSKGQFKTVKEALSKAKAGQHIVILDPLWDEPLITSAGEGKGVIIEGGKDNKEVVWKLPSQKENNESIVVLQNPEGLTLRNLTFDGNNKIAAAISVTGKARGLVIEDVFIKDAKKAGIVFTDCEGSDKSPALVQRSRILGCKSQTAATDTKSGVLFKATSVGGANATSNDWITVSDCRIEGPYVFGAFTFEGSARKIEIRRNRIYQSTDGISIRNGKENGQFYGILVESNTFCSIKDHNGAVIFIQNGGILAQAQNRVNQSIHLQQNYFTNCDVIVKCGDGFKDFPFQPPPLDNARDKKTKEGAPSINAKEVANAPDLPTNPNDDSKFLRYDKSSPVNLLPSRVGVPPE